MSSARVERALREGKRLPPENLLLVGCGFAMASLCTLQSRPEFIGFVLTARRRQSGRVGIKLELRAQWQRAAELLLAEAGVGAFSKQVELALFYDAKLDVA